MNLRETGSRVAPFLFCTALIASTAAQAQAAQRPGPNPTYSQLQKSQEWATRKLASSPRRSAWEQVHYDGRVLKGWVDHPNVKGKVPVVLVLHEVFGLTDSTRNTADEIAAMGYITITPDMLSGYGPHGGGTHSFPNGRAASNALTNIPNSAVDSSINAWVDYADKLPGSDGKVAIVGLSWGGGAAFRYATTQRKDVKAVFVFYDVGPPAITQGPNGDRMGDRGGDAFPASHIRLPVYGFYGSKDTRVMRSLPATETAMKAAGKLYRPVVYQNADHAYMRVGEDPANRNAASAAAVKESLVRLRRLLRKTFR